MRNRANLAVVAGAWLAMAPTPLVGPARAEDLGQAWTIALGVNQGLRAAQSQSVASGLNLGAARSARLPTVRTFDFESFLSATPSTRNNFLGGTAATSGAGGAAPVAGGAAGVAGSGAAGLAGIPATIPILGAGQRQLPVSLTFASVPIYTGGRIKANIDAAGAQVAVQRTEEFRTALDLKLTVAQAYVGVLRARKELEVTRSDVERLASFARDARNRGEQGLAIRSDVLAAEVSLANARLAEIRASTGLETAWATYNRYLCRPLATVVPLDELADLTIPDDWRVLADQAARAGAMALSTDEAEVHALTDRAIRNRPELAGLVAQARSLGSQARSTLSQVKPQVSFTTSYLYLGNENSVPQGIGSASFIADWTITDGGASRQRSAALREQERASVQRRNDAAADVALEVRTRWLDLRQSRQRVPIARLAVVQSDENLRVLLDRYREQLSTYTEVLDAENRRVVSLNNFYNAIYDESLALFRLRRAVGDL